MMGLQQYERANSLTTVEIDKSSYHSINNYKKDNN